MYSFRTTHGPVELAFTDRHGGVSADDFAAGAEVVGLEQVHGAGVDVVDGPRSGERRRADGIVTAAPDVVLLVRAADCVPVVLVDATAGVVGAAHSGRPGLAAGVVPATVARMRDLGARDIEAWVGPHVCGACYEVPAAMQQEVASLVPASLATTSWGTPSLDLGAGVRAQLTEAGVGVVHDVSRCTRESADLYSYRRDGAESGRQAGLVVIRRHTPRNTP